MNISNLSLPYPVLGISDDIIPLPELPVIQPVPNDPTDHIITLSLNTRNPYINNLIKEGKALYACEVECRKTFFRECFTSTENTFTLRFPRKSVSGSIVLTPTVVAANNNLQESEFLGNDEKSGAARGIRAIIQQRNKEVLTEVNKLKEKYANGGFGSLETKEGREKAQAAYDEAASKVRKDENLKKPVIIIKSTPQASFGSLVEVLDEMQINSISKYQIDNMTKADSTMVIDYQNRHHK